MDIAPQRHPIGERHCNKELFFLITAETRQHSQHICDEAASAQERTRWREHCGVKCSTPERVLTRSFTGQEVVLLTKLLH